MSLNLQRFKFSKNGKNESTNHSLNNGKHESSDDEISKNVSRRYNKLHVVSESEDENDSNLNEHRSNNKIKSPSTMSSSSDSDSDIDICVKNKRSRLYSISESGSDDGSDNSEQQKLQNSKPVKKKRRIHESSEDDSDTDENKEKAFSYIQSKFKDMEASKIKSALKQTNFNALNAIQLLKSSNEVKNNVNGVKKVGKRQAKDYQISSSSDESEETAVSRRRKHKHHKASQKHKQKKKSNHFEEENGNDEIANSESDDESDEDEPRAKDYIYDSDDESTFCDDTLTPERSQVIEFLQNSNEEELQHIPNCGLKKVKAIMDARPFTGWLQLIKKLKNAKYIDTDVLQGALFVINMRDSLNKLLNKCEKLSEQIFNDAGHLLTDPSGQTLYAENKLIEQPNMLNKNYSLKPHQLLAINWMYLLHKNSVNCILADEMGLGKTIETIGFLSFLHENNIYGPHAVIVPSSTLNNWIREIERWCPKFKVLAYVGNQKERLILRHNICKNKSEKFDVLISTYNLVTRNPKDLLLFKKYAFNYAVFDEAHMMKNAATQCYRCLMQVNAKRRLLLTGTPLQNNLMELLSILMFAMPSLFKGNRSQIEKMFAIASKGCHDGNYYKNRITQAKQILKPFMLRRLKDDVLHDLPEKKRDVIKCKMLENQNTIYQNCLKRYIYESQDLNANGLAMMMELRKIANHPLLLRNNYTDKKLLELAEILAEDIFYKEDDKDNIFYDLEFMSDYNIHQLCKKYTTCKSKKLNDELILYSGKFRKLDELLPTMKLEGNKVLIFSQFTMVLDVMESYMDLRNHKFIRLDGSTPVLQRQDLMDEFNNNEDVFVFLLSTRSGGLGINLTSANVVILHDIDFNPFNDRQAEDRCHRVGQTRDVTVIRLITEGSIEENMMERAERKLRLEKRITGDIADDDTENDTEVIKMLSCVLQKS